MTSAQGFGGNGGGDPFRRYDKPFYGWRPPSGKLKKERKGLVVNKVILNYYLKLKIGKLRLADQIQQTKQKYIFCKLLLLSKT